MTLFKISCDTCQTSLNVRQKSAIGQILACPKCGSMVQVKPPEDWQDPAPPTAETPKTSRPFVKPVPDPNLPETLSTMSGSVSEGLQKPPRPTTVPAQKWQGDQDPKPPLAPQNQSATREPVLPGDQWNSSQGQQRRKLLFAFSTTLAILVFAIAAIVFAVIQFGGDREKKSVADGKGNSDTMDSRNENPGEKQPDKQPGQAQPKTPTKDIPNQADAPDTTPKTEPGKTGSPDKANQPAEKEKQPVNPAKKAGDSADQGPEKSDPKNTDPDAPPGFEDPGDPVEDTVLPDFFRELDEFSVIFEQDEPLLKLRQAFQEDDLPGEFGLSRFYVSKALKKTPDPKLAMNVPIGELTFRQITLLEFLDFHFQLTSVPVAVDVTPILLAGIQLNRPFDIVVKEKTTGQVLEAVAETLGLVLIKANHSLVLTIPDRDKPVELEYSVSDIAPTAAQRQKLIDQIRVFINSKSWSSSGGPGIATANDEKQSIAVKHAGWAQVRVQEFLRHTRIRKGLPPKKENPNFQGGQHRLFLSKPGKNKKITILHSDPISLSKLFASLAKQNDLHVFVNWEATGESLLPSGNLPLAIEEENFEQFIGEFAGGLQLELVWHGENVVELTSKTGAASNLTFESYNIEKAISGSFTADKLLLALKNLLATNQLADFKKSEIGIDRDSGKALYAVLPQTAHQNILKILNTAILNTAEPVDEK